MMTKDDAYKLLEGLRERFSAPYSSSDKDMIIRLYSVCLGKVFAPTSCQNCFHDAVIELCLWMKNNRPMAKERKYILKAGAILNSINFENGRIYSNANLTDEVAAKYLEMYPEQIVLFAKYEKPQKATKRAAKAKKDAGKVVEGAEGENAS